MLGLLLGEEWGCGIFEALLILLEVFMGKGGIHLVLDFCRQFLCVVSCQTLEMVIDHVGTFNEVSSGVENESSIISMNTICRILKIDLPESVLGL